MAISGAYSGQLFGLLVGFGFAQLRHTLHHGVQDFQLFHTATLQENSIILAVMGTMFLVML